eukprot:CAMPEP_0114344614 /NCGR_PEP_ID=MMETSP0101-20121206/11563_1 /TAXON_ID=38822 ORGANISM="Pteridomonas danica, Strain PT" /NCGR_SAMPLE_ID=MMETSP0101 /ASSEMBLY_ACC=CAM_ASM_000211 /LENGTH=41 /DNA_ID= /DNA_START= /DNA_END= /DNA_ORIENTATION=
MDDMGLLDRNPLIQEEEEEEEENDEEDGSIDDRIAFVDAKP